jgi:hypothetical protein
MAPTAERQPIHFEKGKCYLGTDTSREVNMSDTRFQGLKEVVDARNVQAGDYLWDESSRELIPAGGASTSI